MSLTKSAFGFIAKIGNDGCLHIIATNETGLAICSMDKIEENCKFSLTGLYARAFSSGKSFYIDSISEQDHCLCLPEGHSQIANFLSVPLLHEEKPMGLIALANKETGFDITDITDLEALAPSIKETLLHKVAENALRDSERRYSTMFNNKINAMIHCRTLFGENGECLEFETTDANSAFSSITGKDLCYCKVKEGIRSFSCYRKIVFWGNE